jgi:hypothetical protein
LEPGQDDLEHIIRTRGFTEDEARIFYHLSRALTLYRQLPGQVNLLNTIRYGSAHQTLVDMLAERVLHRSGPEGWERPYLQEGQEEEQG